MAQERLQKVIAQAGLASRRKAEQFIVDGAVRVNGKIVKELGTKVDPRRDRYARILFRIGGVLVDTHVHVHVV